MIVAFYLLWRHKYLIVKYHKKGMHILLLKILTKQHVIHVYLTTESVIYDTIHFMYNINIRSEAHEIIRHI